MRPVPTLIVAPPPTPNGDLHVGHLSGPYFGADVLRRYLALRGRDVVAALGVDLNQSYVVTTADRLGVDPLALAHQSHAEVASTLARAQIGFDVVGIPDEAYTRRISEWFAGLYASGVVRRRRRPAPYDVRRERFMFESYASGTCPVCLAKTKGNICEACGHPNDARDLIGLYPTGGSPGDPVEMREIDEFYLDLEAMRAPLQAHLNAVIPEKRPALDRLLAELFASPLPAFPLTFPSAWGVPAPFPDAEGLVLNVWAEMVPGHYAFIDRALAARGYAPLETICREAPYVQYLGFDNSFFYVVAQLALALAAREAGIVALLPTAFVTNAFYLLDNFKFSTSQGHLIWGRDLLAEAPVDEVRFYLAWNNPEYNQANFTRSDFEAVVEAKLRRPLAQLLETLAAYPPGADVEESVAEAVLLARFAAAFDDRRPSLRIAAQTIANGFDLIDDLVARGERAGVVRGVALALACGLAPIAPSTADAVWRAAGARGPIRWPGDARSVRAA